MKALILIAACLALSACHSEPLESSPPPSPTVKIVAAKVSPVEQRRHFDWLSKDPWRERSVTVYYLVAKDGMVVEVGLTDFTKTNIGDSFASFNWSTKSL